MVKTHGYIQSPTHVHPNLVLNRIAVMGDTLGTHLTTHC
jgi:hypothetical protein